MRDLGAAGLEVNGKLTFTFDAVNEGFAVNDPAQDIVVTFEFPRKPAWADVAIEPREIKIPISPQYLKPDASNAQQVQGTYVYEVPVKVSFKIVGQPVVPTGYDHAKLLVFAKSTESGLYKAAYGIKQVKVRPEGAVDASTIEDPLAGLAPVDLAPQAFAPMTRNLTSGARLALEPPALVEPWRPAAWKLKVEGVDPGPGHLAAALYGPDGALLYSTGARDVAGSLAFNLTLAKAGRYTLVAVADDAAERFAMGAVAFAFDAGPVEAKAVRYPSIYKASYTEPVNQFATRSDNAGYQYEKWIPLPVHKGAAGGNVAFSLATQGQRALDRGLANLAVSVVDPNGATILTGTIDPANPAKRFNVGAFPGEGLYFLRVQGLGLLPPGPGHPEYNLAVEVTYDDKPILLPDARSKGPVTVQAAGYNWTAPFTESPALWAALEATTATSAIVGKAPLAGDLLVSAHLTDLDGNLVAASAFARAKGAAPAFSTTFPRAGEYLLTLFVATPHARGAAAPIVEPTPVTWRVRTVGADLPEVTLPTTFALASRGQSAQPFGLEDATGRAVLAVPVPVFADGKGQFTFKASPAGVAGSVPIVLALEDRAGGKVKEATGVGSASLDLAGLAPGDYTLLARARTADDITFEAAGEMMYVNAPVDGVRGYVPPVETPSQGFAIPHPALAGGLALAAAALALRRRA